MPDTGPTSERLEALEARWSSDKHSRVFLQLADEYRRLGRPGDAVRVLEEGLAENPRYPAAQVALGRCQLDLGQTAAAAETLERVVASDPTQMVAYRLLVDAYVAQGKPEEARQRLRIYSLLNDADPEIAELRRRIGKLERQDRPEDETAAGWTPTPEPPAPVEPVFAEPAASEPEPASLEPSEAKLDPFPDLAASAPATAEPGEDPFPDLAAPRPVRGAAPDDDLFGLAPPPPAAEDLGPSDPFDLGLSGPPPAPDLSSLLEPLPPSRPEPPREVLPEEASVEAAEAEERGEPGMEVEAEPEALFVVGEAPPEDAPPPVAPAASEGAPAPSPEPPTTSMVTEEELEEVDEVAGAPGERALPPPGQEADRPTVTLGLLYLRQGHTREAEEIFRSVLDRDPDNVEALRHLEEIGEQLRAELAEPPSLTASDLLDGWQGEPREAGTTQRKRYVLERYRDRIREGARRDVH